MAFSPSKLQALLSRQTYDNVVSIHGSESQCSGLFLSCLSQVKYQDKEVIVREGTEANTFYIILKGEVIQCQIVRTNSYLNLILYQPVCVYALILSSSHVCFPLRSW